MSRIAATFEALQKASRKALIPYVTAGFPYADITPELMHGMVDAGADVIELGVPFSDPMADGPTIQRASERALSAVADRHQGRPEQPLELRLQSALQRREPHTRLHRAAVHAKLSPAGCAQAGQKPVKVGSWASRRVRRCLAAGAAAMMMPYVDRGAAPARAPWALPHHQADRPGRYGCGVRSRT